jgi:hypothetical protein
MSKLPNIIFVRTVRTASSERFLVQDIEKPDVDIAAIDVHYLDNQVVTATVIVLVKEYSAEEFINSLLETVDTRLLPMACLNDGDLSFTVVEGCVVGQFTNTHQPAMQ